MSSLTSLFKAILYTKYVGGKITIMENQLREHSVCTCLQSPHFGRGGQEFKMNLRYTARFEASQDYMRPCSKNTKLNKQAFFPLSNALHQHPNPSSGSTDKQQIVLPFNKNLKTTSVLDKSRLFQDNIGMWLCLILKPKAGIVQLLRLNQFWENARKCLTMASATLSRNWEGRKLQAFSRHIRA